MKTTLQISALSLFSSTLAIADVQLTELDDRIRVEIDNRLFTEWRHKEWVAPYLYPVIGPRGESITRQYPMEEGVPGEAQDHPWHRSLRFAHSEVNGFNFWWAPGKERAGHTAEVNLNRIEKMTSGKTGELILWNHWLGDGKLVLRERMTLSFIPLENRELLMDYDVELHAAEEPVVFADQKDGGLLVRVAGTMKVEEHRTHKKFTGTILNSRGDRNADAWGKRAEWVDYSGKDGGGNSVGIAMFDHPTNLRFPTSWHARTYGLLTVNRFGTHHFDPKYAKGPGISCRPWSDQCPACNSRGGDYTLPAGRSILLRHRFYFHHGDAKAANVAKHYSDYREQYASSDYGEHQHLFESGKEGYTRYRIPTLVVTNSGDLLAICQGRVDGGGLTGNVDLICKLSSDNGKTWSEINLIADAGCDTLGAQSAVVDRNTGVIWIACTLNPGEHLEKAITHGETDESTRVLILSSEDDGRTWSQPRDITKAVKRPGWTWYGCGPGVGLQLADGRLFFAAYHREDYGKTVHSHAIFSEDHGKTWQLGGNAGVGNGEPQALQREDGSIYLSARTSGGPNQRSIVES